MYNKTISQYPVVLPIQHVICGGKIIHIQDNFCTLKHLNQHKLKIDETHYTIIRLKNMPKDSYLLNE